MAQAASLGKFKGRLALLRHLEALGPAEAWLADVPPGKVAHFAGEALVTEVADLRKVLDQDKGLTLIVSLLHTVRAGVRDDVVTIRRFGNWILNINAPAAPATRLDLESRVLFAP